MWGNYGCQITFFMLFNHIRVCDQSSKRRTFQRVQALILNDFFFEGSMRTEAGIYSGRQCHCLQRHQLARSLWALGKWKAIFNETTDPLRYLPCGLILWTNLGIYACIFYLVVDRELWSKVSCGARQQKKFWCLNGRFFFLKIPQGVLFQIQVFCQVEQWVLSLLSIFPGLIGTWPLRWRRKKDRSRDSGEINTWLVPLPVFPELFCSLWISIWSFWLLHQIQLSTMWQGQVWAKFDEWYSLEKKGNSFRNWRLKVWVHLATPGIHFGPK